MLTPVMGTLSHSSAPLSLSHYILSFYLESQMFQKMCCSIGLVRFGSATGVDPDADSGCLRPWRMLGRDLTGISQKWSISQIALTVNPLDSVVLSVYAPWLTGVANPLNGDIDCRALRFRKALVKLSASRCVAIAMDESKGISQ